ncbi:MAG: hypothetical protein ACKPJJ_08535, partial [Planctomycetaceae bacterium]
MSGLLSGDVSEFAGRCAAVVCSLRGLQAGVTCVSRSSWPLEFAGRRAGLPGVGVRARQERE